MADSDVQDESRADAISHIADDSSGDDHSSASDNEPAMVVTRTRRSNAGNRMSKLLQLAEAEDTHTQEDYGEIFQEAADDVEFEAEDADEDADHNMESSSEEEGEGADDEDQGEKELKKAERIERSKKRKRDSLLQHAMKRAAARIAPMPEAAPSSSTPAEEHTSRPRKKSERVSWLPEAEQGVLRSSSRHLSVQNKQSIHDRLKEKEKHRLRTVAIMKAAEMRKEASRPKTMTQAERLEEAARTERQNSKSLNRWETAEKKRLEEQAARLEALKNRKLEGPIISYWSGPAVWVNDRLKHVGKGDLVKEVEREMANTNISENDSHMQVDEATAAPAPAQDPRPTPTQAEPTQAPAPAPTPAPVVETLQTLPVPAPVVQTPQPTAPQPHNDQQPITSIPQQSTSSFLDGIHIYANLPPEQQQQLNPPASAPAPLKEEPTSTSIPPQPQLPLLPPPKPRREIAARTLILLNNFTPDLKPKDYDAIRHHLLSWPQPTSTSSSTTRRLAPAKRPVCAITGKEARYNDPVTGLPYVDSYALKMIRRIMDGGVVWSGVAGAFVGPAVTMAVREGGKKGGEKEKEKEREWGRHAKGVPEGFYRGWKPKEAEKGKGKEAEKPAEEKAKEVT